MNLINKYILIFKLSIIILKIYYKLILFLFNILLLIIKNIHLKTIQIISIGKSKA